MSDDTFVSLLILIGVTGLTVTSVLVWRTRRFLARARRTSGRITRVVVETRTRRASEGSPSAHDTSYSYTFFVEFHPEEGPPVEFRARQYDASAPAYQQGEVVPVVYDPARPAKARIAGAMAWQSVGISVIVTFMLLLFAVIQGRCP